MWVFWIVSTILDNIHGKFISPFSQNQTGENGAFWRLRGFILDLGGWGFAVPFYSVQDCSFKPGGVFLGIFGGGVPPGSPNPDPISDQQNAILHTRFQTRPLNILIFRPGL